MTDSHKTPSTDAERLEPRSHQLKYENYRVQIDDGTQLHVRRIYNPIAQGKLHRLVEEKRPGDELTYGPRSAVFFHGFAGSGDIYHNANGGGFAPLLAHQGYNCFVVDWRGKGKSWPSISKHSNFSLFDMITKDIPAVWSFLNRHSNLDQCLCITHGFGAALVMAAAARQQIWLQQVSAFIHFAPYRRLVNEQNPPSFKQRLALRLLASSWVQRLAKALGYYPAEMLGLGLGKETLAVYLEKLKWIEKSVWVDSHDHLDYLGALNEVALPPSLYLSASLSAAWGNSAAVKGFMKQMGAHDGCLFTPPEGKVSGQGGYSGVGLLTDPKISRESFARALNWLERYGIDGLFNVISADRAQSNVALEPD